MTSRFVTTGQRLHRGLLLQQRFFGLTRTSLGEPNGYHLTARLIGGVTG